MNTLIAIIFAVFTATVIASSIDARRNANKKRI